MDGLRSVPTSLRPLLAPHSLHCAIFTMQGVFAHPVLVSCVHPCHVHVVALWVPPTSAGRRSHSCAAVLGIRACCGHKVPCWFRWCGPTTSSSCFPALGVLRPATSHVPPAFGPTVHGQASRSTRFDFLCRQFPSPASHPLGSSGVTVICTRLGPCFAFFVMLLLRTFCCSGKCWTPFRQVGLLGTPSWSTTLPCPLPCRAQLAWSTIGRPSG